MTVHTPHETTDGARNGSVAEPDVFDLIIVGAGSGNSLISPAMDDWRVAIVERDTWGGTCLNRGCIPSKMFVYAADVAHTIKHAATYGVSGEFTGADWPSIRDRVFGRIDPIAAGGRRYRLSNSNVTVFEGDAQFTGERELTVDGRRIRGNQVVLANGARTNLPHVPGLADVDYHTSDSVMRLDRLPEHLVVLGGGYIATELGYVFSSLGSKVTVINRSRRLLSAQDLDISERYTELAGDLFDLHLGVTVERVERTAGGIAVHLDDGGEQRMVEGDVLLLATGRRPNGDQLHAEAAGITIGDQGEVVVDQFGRTTAPGVWALGDVNGRYQLKHMANGEAKVVGHNVEACHLDPSATLRELDSRPAPHAVFTSPQIGAVGPTEAEARASGQRVCVITHPYGDAAYGWALEDNTSFCKLIGDPRTRKVLAAHVIGYQASILAQLLVQGIHLGSTADELAYGQVWIHPALSEVAEQALIKLVEAFDAHDAEDARLTASMSPSTSG